MHEMLLLTDTAEVRFSCCCFCKNLNSRRLKHFLLIPVILLNLAAYRYHFLTRGSKVLSSPLPASTMLALKAAGFRSLPPPLTSWSLLSDFPFYCACSLSPLFTIFKRPEQYRFRECLQGNSRRTMPMHADRSIFYKFELERLFHKALQKNTNINPKVRFYYALESSTICKRSGLNR